MDRRSFLQAGGAAVAPLFVPSTVFSNPPSDRLTHACVGVDGMGWSDLSQLITHPKIEIVAICDVDLARMDKVTKRLPQARRYQDWRELVRSEGDRIDSVNVTVPDHMHGPISMAALRGGKHVYCQKPLAHKVAEARTMRALAESRSLVTQMGNQIQSASVYRTAVRILQDGMIGRVKEVHAWAGAKYSAHGRPPGADPVPTSLDWNLWQGVASTRPYRSEIYHPFHWRRWQAFGGGTVGDFACHILDTPFKALELTAPTSLRANVPEDWVANIDWNTENWPEWAVIEYQFPATRYTLNSSLPVTWYDSGKKPPRELFEFVSPDRQAPGSGALFIGETGRLLLPHVGAPEILEGSEHAGHPLPEVGGFSHYHAYIDACLGKGSTESSFSFAGPLAEATLLGTIALRFPGKQLEWNAETMELTGAPEAQQWVAPQYRIGFGAA